MKKIICVTATLLSPLCLCAEEICEPDVHSDMIYFKHIEGKGYGYKEGYSTLGAFITPYSNFSEVLPFLDLRGHVFNKHWKFAGNAGVGFKWLTHHPLVFGAAAYYDYRQTDRYHYNQVGLSLELLLNRWEVRANGYLPVAAKTHSRSTSEVASYNFEKFAGNSLFYTTTYDIHRKVEFAMKGVDGEVGFHLMMPHEFYTVYLGVGPYYFHSPHHLKRDVIGGQARIQARVTPFLTLQVSDSWDTVFHNNVQGEISVNIPFGGRILKKNGCFDASCEKVLSMQSRMIQPMHRNEIIVADKKKQHYYKTVDPIAQSIYGGPLNFIFVNANAPTGGNGTFEHPFNDLLTAHVASRPNNVFYVLSDLTADYDVVLIQNQSLLGSGIPQTVPIAVAPHQIGLVTIPPQTSFTPAITQDNGSQSLVFVSGDNAVISGLTFNGGPGEGPDFPILANFVSGTATPFLINNLTIVNNTFNSTTQDAIDLSKVIGNVVISNNVFNGHGTGGNGINFDQEGGSFVANATFQNNTFSNFTSSGITVGANESSAGASVITALIQNNLCTDCTIGIYTFSGNNGEINATVLNNIVTGGYDGILLQSNNASAQSVIACNNIVTNTSNFGLYLFPNHESNVDYFICNNTLNSNVYGLGFNFVEQTDVSMTALIQGNTIKNNSGIGMLFDAVGGSMTMATKMTIEDNLLIDNGGSYVTDYSFYYKNSSTSTITLFMNGNQNTSFKYGLENDNTAGGSFNIEKGGINIGIIDQIGFNSGSLDPFNIVDRHTAAP